MTHELKFPILAAMKRIVFLLAFSALMALPAAAQTMTFGFQLGSGSSLEGGFDIEFDDSIREIYFGASLEPESMFKVKAGEFETAEFGSGGTVQYIDALVEYKFSEVFGSTGIFAGPGFYRSKGDVLEDDEDTDYGFSIGVNGHFPVTRRFGLTAEAGYHWAKLASDFQPNDEGILEADSDRFTFLTLTGGVRFNF